MLLKLGIEIGSVNLITLLRKWAMWEVANVKILAFLCTCW